MLHPEAGPGQPPAPAEDPGLCRQGGPPAGAGGAGPRSGPGAKIYGEVVGYGATCDAYHITAPDPKGTWSAACIQQALDDAGLSPEQVDYVNAHGTSTPLNDSGETAAIHQVSATTPRI